MQELPQAFPVEQTRQQDVDPPPPEPHELAPIAIVDVSSAYAKTIAVARSALLVRPLRLGSRG